MLNYMLNSFKKLYIILIISLFTTLFSSSVLRAASDETAHNIYPNQARIQFISARKITALPGESISFHARLINMGTAAWENSAWAEQTLRSSTTTFYNPSWISSSIVVENNSTVAPSQPLDINFTLLAPENPGNYTTNFYLTVDGQVVNGSNLQVPVTVKKSEDGGAAVSSRVLIPEPTIRVALYKATSTIQFVSPVFYNLESNNSLLTKVAPNQLVKLSYEKGVYKAIIDDKTLTSTTSLRLTPEDAASSFFTLKNYTQTIAGRKNINFNSYRGILELNYSSKYTSAYVINELPLEKYVAGVAEAGNGVPTEFMKALIVAERSYAYDRINYAKRTKQLFDVLSNTSDQLYLGYNSENTLPEAKAAAISTMGEMVTYFGNPVSTPYFGRSSGQTKNAKDVWGGADRPWLHSVEAVYDKGKTQWGHGVGMSAQEAMQRAQKDNWTYSQILKYYYTGVEVEKIF